MKLGMTCLAVLLVGSLGLAAQPSFVVILCDDLGYGDLGCYGHPRIKSPNLDRMAKEGIRLTACYSSAPVCSPSRAGLMTGRHPNRYGIRDWIPENSGIYLPQREVTIAKLLKLAGYKTAMTGKWHLNSRTDGSEPTPGEHGFDSWFYTQNNAAPNHLNPINFIREGQRVGPLSGNSSSLIIDEALRFVKSAGDSPFGLFVNFHAPHEPVAVPDDWAKRYADIDDPTKRTYFASVELLDAEVGRLLAALDQLKSPPLVFFTSDNGPETLKRYKNALRSHGSPGNLRGMKLHVTEGGIRVPGILRWPGRIQAGQVSDQAVNNLDVLPTLCELAGIKPPQDRFIDGASVVPMFKGEPIQRTVPLYWQYDKALGDWKVALRQDEWKLLADGKLAKFALYNLVQDIRETDDRAAAEPERLATMKKELLRMHQQINAGAGVER